MEHANIRVEVENLVLNSISDILQHREIDAFPLVLVRGDVELRDEAVGQHRDEVVVVEDTGVLDFAPGSVLA